MSEAVPKHLGVDWVQLSCDHYVKLGRSVTRPEKGDEYWCIKHNKFSTVTRILDRADQYIMTCDHGCRGRNWGASKLNAQLACTRHSQKHPGHLVTLRDGNGRVIQESSRASAQESLLDRPPF
jgi:hypothetical protein